MAQGTHVQNNFYWGALEDDFVQVIRELKRQTTRSPPRKKRARKKKLVNVEICDVFTFVLDACNTCV